MKTLVYGLQSSGASLFSYFLAQKPETIGIIDLMAPHLAPNLDHEDHLDIVLKAVINTTYSFEEHVKSFKPDRTILFLRDVEKNQKSLSKKYYGNANGSLKQKFCLLEYYQQANNLFDFVVTYEDFLSSPKKIVENLAISKDYYRFRRSAADILEYNKKYSPWAKQNYMIQWGFGNIHWDEGLLSPSIKLL